MDALTSQLVNLAISADAADAKAPASLLLSLPSELVLEILTHLFRHHRIILHLSSLTSNPLQFDYSLSQTRRALRDYFAIWIALPAFRNLMDEVFFGSIAIAFRSIERHGGGENIGREIYDLLADMTRAVERWCRTIVVEVEVGDVWFLQGILASASVAGLNGGYNHWIRDAPDGYGYLPRTFAVGVTLQASVTQLNGFKTHQAGVLLYDCRSGRKRYVQASGKRVEEIKEVLQAVVAGRCGFSLQVARSIMALVKGWDWRVEKGHEPYLA
ncbi:hypothetical protein EJ03DRAFT_354572 [Teratosphaeria nubilosa]|uniref:Uncharacterized protein n=1 Tax=Teratosphaeria nubilosa TaxID=161662 RepID=A0A6G1KZS6_9PEZI|nr:hypothetical protein EJ03DRAFT_354572 [Teratosphaeria nubilosa]